MLVLCLCCQDHLGINVDDLCLKLFSTFGEMHPSPFPMPLPALEKAMEGLVSWISANPSRMYLHSFQPLLENLKKKKHPVFPALPHVPPKFSESTLW